MSKLPSLSPALSIAVLALCTGIATAAAQAPIAAEPASTPVKARSMQDILDGSAPSDWRALDPANTLYMDAGGGRAIIELAPQFAPAHAENIRTLARGHYWDGLSIYRSQDNFVVQFGDPTDPAADGSEPKSIGKAKKHLPAEFVRDSNGLDFTVHPDSDGYAPQVGFVDGFPVGRHPDAGTTWLAHCYGMLGAGRDMAADSSNGTELYVVTGQSPRQLDRNITLVGRVVSGMEYLSAIPRGPEPMGVYQNADRRAPITSIRLASEVPEDQRVALEVLRTDTPLFEELVESRRNRRDDWYKVPAGHIDLCNVPLPTRLVGDDKRAG